MRPLLHLALLLGCASIAACGGGSGSASAIPTATRSGAQATRTPTVQRSPGARTPTRSGTQATQTPTRSGTPATQTPTRPGSRTGTPTPTQGPAAPQVLYVRANGDDANPGTSPDQALRSIVQAAKLLKPGATVYVGPGRYTGRVAVTGVKGTADMPVLLLADDSGAHTGDRAGAVTLDADGDVVALVITKSTYVTFDGFFITGAAPKTDPTPLSATAVQVRSASANTTITNCVIANGSTADGIRVDTSADVLIFNNLLFANDRGITITGDASDARVINNTIATSERAAIVLRQKGGIAPTGATVLNNIIQENASHIGISIDQGPPSSMTGYTGDNNLVFEPDVEDQTQNYNPPTARGDHDINSDAQFENLPQGDVHLVAGSPAIDHGSDRIGTTLLNALLKRSTAADGAHDRAPVDLGYHYPTR